MIPIVLFLAAIVLVPLACGAVWWVHPELHSLSRTARIAAVYLVGLVLATTLAALSSLFGVAWHLWQPVVMVPIAVLAWVRTRRTTAATAYQRPDQVSPRWALFTVVLLGLSYGAATCAGSDATSVDYVFHWGVKGVHFALARGIDFELLHQPFAVHTHITYPPLWPSLLAWGAIAAGEMPWLAVPWLMLAGLTVATPLVHDLLRTCVGRHAIPVTAFWYLAMTANLTAGRAGGNADLPLLLFETVAVLAFLAETRACTAGSSAGYRGLAAVALAGAVLTKNEGVVAVVLILAGVLVRSMIRREPRSWLRMATVAVPAVLVFGLWLVTRQLHGLPLTDPVREPVFALHCQQPILILKLFIRNLDAGTCGLSWLLPLVLLLAGRAQRLSHVVDRVVDVLPALLPAIGLLGFAFFYYLHIPGDPTAMINWTLSRLSLPALSAWILAAGVLCFRR